MIRYLVTAIGVAGLIVVACAPAMTTPKRAGPDPVYSVAALRERLARDGRGWIGRTVLVRGVFANCGPSNGEPAYCLTPSPAGRDAASAIDPLPLALARTDPLTELLRHVPVLASLVPKARAVTGARLWSTASGSACRPRWAEVHATAISLRKE
jgi:hypothetical protein